MSTPRTERRIPFDRRSALNSDQRTRADVAEAERDRLRELVQQMDEHTLILRQEAWPEADLYLHGSKVEARAIRASDLRRLKALGEECAEALELQP